MPKALTHLVATRRYRVLPEVVWGVVAGGFGEVAAYNPGIARSEWLGDQREGVGAGRVCHFAPKGSAEERITAWDAGHSFEIEVVKTSLPMDTVRSRYTVVPDDDGARLTQDFWYRMKGLLGPFSGLMRGQMQTTLDTGLDALADHLAEAG